MDRYSSNLSRSNRIWHLKYFKNLGLFMTVIHICSRQHQPSSRGRWASKRLLMEFVSIWARNGLLSGLFDDMLYKLDMQDPQKNDCWTCLKVRQSFRDPDSWKSLPNILQDKEKGTENCLYRQSYLWNFLLHEKVYQILGACRLKMDVKKNFTEEFWVTVQTMRCLYQF